MKICYIKSILLISISSFSYAELHEGDECSSKCVPGICRMISDCPIAIQDVIEKHEHSYDRCESNDDDEELLCGPNIFNILDAPQQIRVSQRACNQYSGYIEVKIDHVYGGTNAGEKEFPHMAALAFNHSGEITYDCGGSLISDRFVLTAAHCFVYEIIPFRVRLGVTVLNDTNHLDVDIKKFIIHPFYNTHSKHNDIALIELAKRLIFCDGVLPACLYSTPDDPLGLIVSGWGATLKEETKILQRAVLRAVPLEECKKSVEARSVVSQSLRSNEICAIGSHQDSCMGDSGGPLQIMTGKGGYRIVGIVSRGPGGCMGTVPGIYTRVSSYVRWIENIVWK